MPQTTIVRQTWHCTDCRYESDRLVGCCSTNGCKGDIFQETDPARCGSMTVIGPEDIQAELAAINAARVGRGKAVLPNSEATAYVAQRTAEMNAAITSIKLRTHDAKAASNFNAAIGV